MTQYPFSGAGRTLSFNHEAEYYSDPSVGENPFSDSNGVLSITASAAAPGSNPLNLPYDSGVITTDKSFGQLYGYFEISAKLPSEAGLWPAFWMLPVNGQPATELDIFELLGINATTLHATTHSEVAGDGLSQALSVANTSTGFHTYGVDWEPSTITFYMDGKVIASAATPPDMNVPMYMLVNLAVGGTGSWPGAANAATFTPATMQIDYVRAYATAATVGTSNSSAPTIATVLPTVQAAAVAGKSSLTVSVSNYNQGAVQAGVGVALLNAAGQIIATGITGATGNYTFTGLAGGTYQVKYIPQASFALQSGSQANITTGLTAPFALATGQVLSLVHEAVLNNGYLAGSVQVLGSAQLAGISVALLNSSGATVATTTTNASGSFSFYAPPGNYSVQYLPPAGTVVGIGSHANTAGISPAVAIVALQAFTLTPETLVANPSTVTGSVVYANGTASVAEAGVTVTLLSSSGATVATATTNTSGAYSFASLPAGTYQVQYTAPTATALATASAADPITGLTAAITLAGGQTASLPVETLVPAPATLSGTVMFGLPAPTGQAGIAVTLLSSTGAVLATATTDASGAYSFTNLAAGSYQVKYANPAADVLQSGPANASTGLTSVQTLTAGQNLVLAAEVLGATLGSVVGTTLLGTTAQAGATVQLLNSTGSAALATTTTNASGAYNFTGIATGYYMVKYLAPTGDVILSGPASTTTGQTAAFGVTAGAYRTMGAVTFTAAPAPVAGTITGSTLLGSAGQVGMAVTLLSSSGATVATTTTSASGAFSFASVTAGSYQVQYTAPAGELLQSGPGGTTGLTSTLSLAAGQTLALAAEILVAAPATITGSTLLGSAAQAGMTVTLLSSSGAAIATTTTGASGAFGFASLAAGSYQVQYTAPTGELLQSGPGGTTGLTSTLTLAAGQTVALAAETLAVAPAAITGSVLFAGAGQPGVTVTLLNSAGTAVATATSDSNGAFSFANLAAGSYALAYTAPAADSFQAGDPANTATGVTAAITVAAGQSYAAAAEHLVLTPVSLAMNGSRTMLIEGDAPFIVTGNPSSGTLTLGNANQNVTLGGYSNVVTLGNGNDTVNLAGSLQTLHVGNGAQTINMGGNFDTVTLGNTPAGQSSTVAVVGTGETVTGGSGNITVTGPTGSSTVTLGNGNDTVTLSGSHNTVTLGTGTSTITAGTNSAIVLAAGGTVTVSVAGQSNLVDIGPGAGTINAGSAARLDIFMTNAASQGLTIINGFNTTAGNVLDLVRTLTGTAVASNLSNIGSYITAATSGGNTTLSVDPTGGSGPASAFAVLNNLSVSVSQLSAAHAFSNI